MFDQFVKMFLKIYHEKMLHHQQMSQAIRLGPNQLPHIYQHLVDCCEALGVEVPEMYLQNSPEINAFAMGDTRRMVTVTWGLLHALDDDELHAVIAHECGHLVCQHTLYRTMVMVLLQGGLQVAPLLATMARPIQIALAYWTRRSERSADRAAAVVLGGPQPVVETMIRLAGGPKAITGKVNLGEYLKQAEAFDKMAENTWDRVLQGMAVMDSTHPFCSVRAREILRWCEGEQYRRLQDAIKGMEAGQRCGSCTAIVAPGWKFCRICGAAVGGAPAGTTAVSQH